jgi:hypothetical protein
MRSISSSRVHGKASGQIDDADQAHRDCSRGSGPLVFGLRAPASGLWWLLMSPW